MKPKTQVTVVFGPLKGRKGTIVSTAPSKRVVVQIVLHKRRVLLELDKDMVDRVQ